MDKRWIIYLPDRGEVCDAVYGESFDVEYRTLGELLTTIAQGRGGE